MKKVVAIGIPLPGDEIEYISLSEKMSLLDADIIIVTPAIQYSRALHEYQGRPALSDSQSFSVRESASHWRRQLTAALDAGKTVVVYLSERNDVFIATGTETHSGTGRNRITTRHVTTFDNYSMLPFKVGSIITASGKKMKLTGNVPELKAYWERFADQSCYDVYVEESEFEVGICTTSANKAVGGLLRLSKGNIILLPSLDLDWSTLEYEENGEEFWTEEAERLSKSLISALITLDDFCRKRTGKTPPPEWVLNQEYRSPEEDAIEQRIIAKIAKIEYIEKSISELHNELDDVISLKSLLYETGECLELAVRQALSLFGFDTTHFSNDESEFDAVFSYGSTRMLGEIEGKDKKPVNVDKLSQLERNIQEDFSRDDVSDYAKGVLFSNGLRFSSPEQRGEMFTDKVRRGATRAGIALVRTPDMFQPAQYLKANRDPAYAAACRQAIIDSEGVIVSFPAPPQLTP